MPTLEEYRRWLQGDDVEGLPERDLEVSKFETPVVTLIDQTPGFAITERGGHYILDPGGQDATINFGKYKGCTISELAGEKHTITYLEWMLNQDFPLELMKIVKAYAHPFGPEAIELGLVDADEPEPDDMRRITGGTSCPKCGGDGLDHYPDGLASGGKCGECRGTGAV